LHYLVHEKGMHLHGSNNKDLNVLNPQKATGTVAGQAETAVYATVDVLMAIFFAVIDRSKIPIFATLSTPYQFYIARTALLERPWIEGMMYIFDTDSFESNAGGHPVSYEEVSPIGKLLVRPDDFPMLDEVQPIDSLDGVPKR